MSCGKEMNVAFGIVGVTIIADGGPKKCPDCGGLVKQISGGWNARPDEITKMKLPYAPISIPDELDKGRSIKEIEHTIMLAEEARAKDPGKKLGRCGNCENATVIDEETGLCGPCKFGDKKTAYGNW